MEKSIRLFHWLPRIICILAILFVSMFALDAFSPELTIWQQIVGFLIHLIPSYILLAMLIVAWKWEFSGGITLTITGLAFCVSVFLLNHNRNQFSVAQSTINALLVAFPFVLVGVLFIVSYRMKKRKREEGSRNHQI